MGTDVEMRATEAVTDRAMRSPAAGIALWALKAVAVWIALLVSTVVAMKILPVSFPQPPQDGPISFQQAWLLVTGVWAATIALVAELARVRGVRLALLVFVAYFGATSFMMVPEELYFNDSLHMTIGQIFGGAAQFAIWSALVAAVVALLFRRGETEPAPVPSWMTLRIVVLTVVYVFLYYSAGQLIAWQSAVVRAFYENAAHIEPVSLLAVQVARGFLWALIALFIVTRLKGSMARRVVVMAILFAAFTATQLLLPNPLMPWAVRSVHLVEVAVSEAVYGVMATLILLGGAARRPLSASSSWRLIAGRA